MTVKRYEQRKRTDRKWKPDPDLDREIAELTAAKDAA